jgi:hypothetical protein
MFGIKDGTMTYEDYFNLNWPWMLRSDAVYCLGHSPGTDRELVLARKKGLPIFWELDTLQQWIDGEIELVSPEEVADFLSRNPDALPPHPAQVNLEAQPWQYPGEVPPEALFSACEAFNRAMEETPATSVGGHGHPRFYELLAEMRRVHDAKNHDYAGSRSDPLANFRLCEAMGLPGWKGVLVRLTDKMSRLTSFAKQGTLEVKDESVCDTFLDLAVYALLGRILFEEQAK